MRVAIAIQHDFAYGSYCVSAIGSDTWRRLVYDSMTEKKVIIVNYCPTL